VFGIASTQDVRTTKNRTLNKQIERRVIMCRNPSVGDQISSE
jgi:hypothetical protein